MFHNVKSFQKIMFWCNIVLMRTILGLYANKEELCFMFGKCVTLHKTGIRNVKAVTFPTL